MNSPGSDAVDAYIASSKPFAQPILRHIRALIHKAAPEVEEQIKWGMPFFVYKGVILGNMAGHKEHCSFGLWGQEMVRALQEAGLGEGGNMGSIGRICSVRDLPPDPVLRRFLDEAVALIGEGKRTQSIQRVAKPGRKTEVELPEALATALRKNPAAAAKFQALSPSCRREYATWVAEAKREETRTKRVTAALEMIAEGKGRHWKYEKGTVPAA